MGKKDKVLEPDTANLAAKKQPYTRPVLRTYGMLHRLTQASGPANGDGGQNMMQPSDRRLKQNIVRLGSHPLGFGLYLFDYKPEYRKQCGEGRHFGVMADEVEEVMPSAVAPGFGGFKAVDYGQIGISFPD